MIDKPLYDNPLGGSGLSFRQEGDMGRYVADNDPGGIAAGFSNLQDYLAAGNKLPEQKTSNDLIGVSNANFNVSPPGTLKLDPQATMDTLGGFNQITAPHQIPERYRQGFEDFYNQNPNDYRRIGGQAVSYVTTPQGETIRFGDTGGASNFRRYLESIGETPKPSYGDLSIGTQLVPDNNAFPASPVEGVSQDVFGKPNILRDSDGNPLPSFTPIRSPGLPPPQAPLPDTTVDPLQSLSPLETNPYNRVGQQLTGPNQVGDFNSRLNKIEQGIMSLLRNRGQGFNRGYQPNYGFNMGFGYSFPPFGGMYG